MPRRIEYYFSILSPWSFIGHEVFGDIARRHGAQIVYKPAPILEVFAQTGGVPVAKRHPSRQAYRLVELQRWRAKRKPLLKLRPKHWPFDADLANCVVLAIAANGGDPFGAIERAFRGVWERDEDLADCAVLSRILTEAGFAADAVLDQAALPATREGYVRNGADAIAAGVFGAPAYVLDGEVFWGQDRLDLLDEALASGREPYLATA